MKGGYRRLRGATGGYKGLQGATSGYRGLLGVIDRETCFLTRTCSDTFTWSFLHKNHLKF